jgi:hypothetical protein
MNDRDDPPRQAEVTGEWRQPVAGAGQPDPRAADLDARTSVLRGYTRAALDRAGTTDAAMHPPAADRDPQLVKILAAAGRYWQACVPGSWVPGYLASRSLDPALLPTSPWKIGYAPASWTALLEHLRGLGFCASDMLCAGLVVNGANGRLHDHFHDRLIIPLRAEDGIAAGFAGAGQGPAKITAPST